MSYIDKNLISGESVIYRSKLHWSIFIWPIIWLVIAIIFFIHGSDFQAAGSLFATFALLTGIVSFINYLTFEFGLTNKRIIFKQGFIRRKCLEVLLSKVESFQVDQGILGRILGYGSIVVGGTGSTKDPFRRISKPLELRKKAHEQIALVQESR